MAPRTIQRNNLVENPRGLSLVVTDGGPNDGKGIEAAGTSDGAQLVYQIGSDTMRSIAFELTAADLQALGAGTSHTFTIRLAAAVPVGEVFKVFSESQFSPGSPWVPFDDGLGATYAVDVGNASLSNGVISNWDVANDGSTGAVSSALGLYALGNALMPSPAEDLTLTISSSVDLNTTTQGHLSIVLWIGNALPA